MADLFSSKPGKVIAVTGNGLPMTIVIGRPPGARFGNSGPLPGTLFGNKGAGSSFPKFKAIIQNVGLSGQGGFQFMHTLRDYIYVYVFGERVGELLIGGLAFHSGCDEDEDDPDFDYTGFERVFDYYQLARITTYPLALTAVIGDLLTFDAFLTGANVSLTNPETNLSKFTLRLHCIPNQTTIVPEEGGVGGGDFGEDDDDSDEDGFDGGLTGFTGGGLTGFTGGVNNFALGAFPAAGSGGSAADYVSSYNPNLRPQ